MDTALFIIISSAIMIGVLVLLFYKCIQYDVATQSAKHKDELLLIKRVNGLLALFRYDEAAHMFVCDDICVFRSKYSEIVDMIQGMYLKNRCKETEFNQLIILRNRLNSLRGIVMTDMESLEYKDALWVNHAISQVWKQLLVLCFIWQSRKVDLSKADLSTPVCIK